MGFFDALRQALKPPSDDTRVVPDVTDDEDAAEGDEVENVPEAEAVPYDRDQWHKKMKRVLGELPNSRHEWDDLMLEARALGFDEEWVTRCQVDEFLLLIRRAVSDRRFTEEEHRALELARDLIGIPEPEAEAALNSIVAEAESFFGGPVEGA